MIYPQVNQKLNTDVRLNNNIKNIVHIFTPLIVLVIFYI